MNWAIILAVVIGTISGRAIYDFMKWTAREEVKDERHR